MGDNFKMPPWHVQKTTIFREKLQLNTAQAEGIVRVQAHPVTDERDSLFTEMNDLRESYSQVLADRRRLQLQMNAVLKQAEEQEQELLRADDVLKENQTLKSEIERLSKTERDFLELSAKISSLEEEKSRLNQLCKRTESLEAALSVSRDQLMEARRQANYYEDKAVCLEANIAEALSNNEIYESRLRDLERSLRAAESERNFLRASEEMLSRATAKNCELLKEVEILQNRNEGLSEEVERSNREVHKLQSIVEEREEASRKLLQEQVALNEQILALSTDVAVYKGRCADIEQELQERALSREEHLKNGRERRTEEELYKKALAEAEELRESLVSSKEVLSGRLLQKDAEVISLNEELKKTREELQTLSANASSLNREVSSKEREIENLREELGLSDESKRAMSILCSLLNRKLSRTEGEQEEHKSRLDQLKSWKATLSSELRESISQTEAARTQLNNAFEELDQLKSEREHLLGLVEKLGVEVQIEKSKVRRIM